MKKYNVIIIVSIIVLTSLSSMKAQEQSSRSLLVLDNYTVPVDEKGAFIGNFKSSDKNNIQIIGDESDLFEVSDNILKLKKHKSIKQSSQPIYTIVVSDGTENRTFDIPTDNFNQNNVIAHRGAWKNTGEAQNSLGSIREAIKLGCYAAEIDVWLTKDNNVILCHDWDLDGKIVEKTNLDDLKTVKLSNEETAPTLQEVLELIKTQNKTKLVIELKSNKSNDNVIVLADSVVDIVARMSAQAWVDYISFDYRGLTKIREKDKTAHISLLEPAVELDLQKLEGISGIDYHHSNFNDKSRLFERCAILGLSTNAWTVNNEERMNELLDNDINFITTDEPEMLLKIISEK